MLSVEQVPGTPILPAADHFRPFTAHLHVPRYVRNNPYTTVNFSATCNSRSGAGRLVRPAGVPNLTALALICFGGGW